CGAPRVAGVGTGSLLVVFPVSWTFHDALTHSAAVLAAGAATFHALLRLGDEDGLGAYLGLGVAAGLGLLSKYTYVVLAAALALAALTEPRTGVGSGTRASSGPWDWRRSWSCPRSPGSGGTAGAPPRSLPPPSPSHPSTRP